MGVLELARKVYARIKAQRNGHVESAQGPSQPYDINDRNDKRQAGDGWAAPGYENFETPFDDRNSERERRP